MCVVGVHDGGMVWSWRIKVVVEAVVVVVFMQTERKASLYDQYIARATCSYFSALYKARRPEAAAIEQDLLPDMAKSAELETR